jgi:hypothetical protein
MESLFEQGVEVEEILGISCIHGRIIFLVKFKGYPKKQAEIVTLSQIRFNYPQMVIAFFQERSSFVGLNVDLKEFDGEECAVILDRLPDYQQHEINPLNENEIKWEKKNGDQETESSEHTKLKLDKPGKKVDPLGLDSDDD